MFIFILAPRMEFIKCFNQFAGRWKSLYTGVTVKEPTI